MPRSSKHKSSKHSSRDAGEYSDSEKGSFLKDRREKDESDVKVSKDPSLCEKRKLDSEDGKNVNGSVNGEYLEEYGSSKRRKERSNDGVGDRGNGSEDDRDEGSRKLKTSGDSKSRRRDETLGVYGEGEELKKSTGKSDGKHKDSRRKESREDGAEKDRKFKEGRSKRSVDDEEQRMPKQVFEHTDLRGLEELQSLELDNQLEKRMRKKREDFGSADKHQDDVRDGYDRHMSSRDDRIKNGRQKDEKYRAKYREDMDRKNKHRHDKQRDERPAKDHTGNRSDDKHAKEEKDHVGSRQKRTKLLESDRDRNRDRNRDYDGDQDLEFSHYHERRHEHNHDHDYDLEKDRDYDSDRNWEWDLDRDHDWERDRDCDRDVSHAAEQSSRSKESGSKKRNSDDRDGYNDTKSRGLKIHYYNAEKSSNRADCDADRRRSQPRQNHGDSIGTSIKRRSSPTSNTNIGEDEYRNVNYEDLKFRDSIMDMEHKTKGLRQELTGMSERGPRYKSTKKTNKIDDDPVGDLSIERSSSSKASPMGVVERSPSSTSIECKCVNRSGVRQNLEIEGSGQRNSIDARDFSASEDRLGRESTVEKPLSDEFSQADSSFHGRISQGSLIPPSPFRAGLDRPFMGSLEDDVRDNSNPRYKRNTGPGFGSGYANSCRSVPNWNLPVPNGFVPFHHGPAHGGFQAMILQFPSQPLFGVRPPMEVNHVGVPFRVPDADRFSGHMRPLGWQNMIDSTIPSHFHGWDGNNGFFRDDPRLYGGSDWDQNRHLTSGRGWESGSEAWKEHNDDLKKDLPSPACKDESVPSQVDDGLTEPAPQMSQDEYIRAGVHDDKGSETKQSRKSTKLSSFSSPENVTMNSSPTIIHEKVPDASAPSDSASLLSRSYLSKLDISKELALPEVYDQYMCLLNLKKNACVDSDASTDLFLKNASRAWQKFAVTLSKHSPFLATGPSILQRAIEHYKKERVELPNGERVDIISAFNQVQVDEAVPTPSLEDIQVTVSADDALANLPVSTSDLQKVKTLSSAKQHLEDPNQNLAQKGQDPLCNHSVKLVMSCSSLHEDEAPLAAGLWEKEDEITFKQVNSGDFKENRDAAVINEFKSVSTLPKGSGNVNRIAKITGFAHSADEKLGSGDTSGGPLIFGDGTPKACDTLMLGSNESESLILSRIHHSPDSTH